jgi:hypothetical protein
VEEGMSGEVRRRVDVKLGGVLMQLFGAPNNLARALPGIKNHHLNNVHDIPLKIMHLFTGFLEPSASQ